jgi:ribosomal-protein-alanine N-acetyltransferase
LITLKTKRLALREVQESDLEDIHRLNSMPETDQYNTLGIPENINETAIHFQRWTSHLPGAVRTIFVFRIADHSGNFIGLFGIILGKPKYRNAEIWYKIHPAQWNKGFATETVLRILDFCFNDLKLHRVEAGCATENIASYKVLEKCGFLREAHTRQLLPIRGKWLDNFGYAILENDYFNQIKK